jgi:hypothetical protein
VVDDRRPLKLYLQLDNTSKQNKSKYLFGYLGWLLRTKQVIEECVVSFLPVGHTHADIDQMFSRFSMHLRKHDAHCRQSLCTELQNAFHLADSETTTAYLDRITNFSDWVEPWLENSFFRGLSAYHQFRSV